MFWQWCAVIACIASAAAYIAFQSWRTWSGTAGGCGKGCGSGSCGAKAPGVTGSKKIALIPTSELTLRLRTGKTGR